MIKKLGKWFKKYFIPHTYNDHRPHILRTRSMFLILGIIFFSEIFFLAQIFLIFRKSDFLAAVLPDTLVTLTNSDRETENISAVKVNSKLQVAAQLKANDMAEKEYFSHTSPAGVTPWYWFEKAGYKFSYAGENLAVNFFDSNDVNNAWMGSPSHKENIMNMSFTEIGIGIARGKYKGQDAIFIVQLFGRPLAAGNPSETAVSVADKKIVKPIVSPAAPIPVSVLTPTPAASTVEEGDKDALESTPESVSGASSGPNSDNYGDMISILEENPSPSPRISRTGQLLSMPRLLTNYIFLSLLAIVFVALTLKIMVRVRIQYPVLIMNGLLLLAIISVVLLFNKYVNVADAMIF